MKDYIQTKIKVAQLIKGMYVCKLDRPWVETPFPFQGFFITRQHEIELLRQYCQFVFIDMDRGVAPDNLGFSVQKIDNNCNNVKSTRFKVRHDYYPERKAFSASIKSAQAAYLELNTSVTEAFNQVRVGRKPDLRNVQPFTEKIVKRVVDSPDTFLWLSHLKQVDDYSYNHSIRMSILALLLGRHIGLSENRLNHLALGCLFADIGNTRISKKLLIKTGKYTDDEMSRIRQHVDLGLHIMSNVPGFPDESREIIATHHERYDGSGYNKGLSGDKIPLIGRIAGLVDTFDAITNPRHHRPTTTPAKALDEIYRQKNVLFQDQLVDEFIQAIGIYPSGTVVELNTGEAAVVISHDSQNRLRPVVAVIMTEDGDQPTKPKTLDLNLLYKKHNEDIQIMQALPASEFDINYAQIHEQQFQPKMNWLRFFKTV